MSFGNDLGNFEQYQDAKRNRKCSNVSVRIAVQRAANQDIQIVMSQGISEYNHQEYRRYRRRQLRTSILLFIATLLSTFLVGSQFIPLNLAPALVIPEYRELLEAQIQRQAAVAGVIAPTLESLLYEACMNGLRYAVPLMLILFCHEMGHFLQSVRYQIPASFPYFIPLPLPPLGTMGAVILQGRGVADRRQMFDIAVSGPIAGLLVTLPILYYGILTSKFEIIDPRLLSMKFGNPLLLTWMIELLHAPIPENAVFVPNGYAFAGWVGVFITAMNLLPVGQLDGGHILYTLIGRSAHLVAWLVIAVGVGLMMFTGTYSYILLIILLMLTGARHPPTANDRMSLGWCRHVIGWLTLSFLIIGFTPQPIIVQEQRQQQNPPVDRNRRIDPAEADPELLVMVRTETAISSSPRTVKQTLSCRTLFQIAKPCGCSLQLDSIERHYQSAVFNLFASAHSASDWNAVGCFRHFLI